MTEAREACTHHWLLESPNGETSKGTCKKCGSERDYYNALEDMREGSHWMRVRDVAKQLKVQATTRA